MVFELKMICFGNTVEICQMQYVFNKLIRFFFLFSTFRTKMIGLSQGSGPCISRRFASESFTTVTALFNYPGTLSKIQMSTSINSIWWFDIPHNDQLEITHFPYSCYCHWFIFHPSLSLSPQLNRIVSINSIVRFIVSV